MKRLKKTKIVSAIKKFLCEARQLYILKRWSRVRKEPQLVTELAD